MHSCCANKWPQAGFLRAARRAAPMAQRTHANNTVAGRLARLAQLCTTARKCAQLVLLCLPAGDLRAQQHNNTALQ